MLRARKVLPGKPVPLALKAQSVLLVQPGLLAPKAQSVKPAQRALPERFWPMQISLL